jgi:hypothetical protein
MSSYTACTSLGQLTLAKTERFSDNAVLFFYDYTTTRVCAISLSVHNL